MNYEAVTIQDCIVMHDTLKKAAVIENGNVTEFIREEDGDERTGIRAYKSLS